MSISQQIDDSDCDEGATESEDEMRTSDVGKERDDLPYVQRRLIKWYAVVLLTFQFLYSLSDTALNFLLVFISNFFSLLGIALFSSPLQKLSSHLPTNLIKAKKISNTSQKNVQSVTNCITEVSVLLQIQMVFKYQNAVQT